MPADPADFPEEAVAVVVLQVPPQVALLPQVAVAVAEDSPVAVAVVAAQPVSSVAPRTQRRSVPA